jgi:hypothetical protein
MTMRIVLCLLVFVFFFVWGCSSRESVNTALPAWDDLPIPAVPFDEHWHHRCVHCTVT